MPLYTYEGLSKGGKKIKGVIDAVGKDQVKIMLAQTGVYATSIELAGSGQSDTGWSLFASRVSSKDIVFFTKQLSVLLRAGIQLAPALDLLVEQTDGQLRRIVVAVRDQVNQGSSLADALSKYPRTFDTLYVQLVRAGEASGKLELILERLVAYIERSQAVRKKVSDALRYPLIQLGFVTVVVIGLVTQVVPQVQAVFAENNTKLPWPTRFVIGISNFLRNHSIGLLVVIGLSIAALRWFKATSEGRGLIDRVKLWLPIVGYFTKFSTVVQFCRTLGMLLEARVHLPQALDIVVRTVDNTQLLDALSSARDNIIKQGKIAQYLKGTQLFPPVALYLINTGEQSGQLDTMLLSVAQYYEDELQERADALSSLLNPIMLAVVGVVVGFVIMAVMMPIFRLMSTFTEQTMG